MTEKNELTRAMKKKLVRVGLGFIHVRGGKGTAYNWIDMDADRELTQNENDKLFKTFGFRMNRCSQHCVTLKECDAYLGYGDSLDLIQSPEYCALKKQFEITAVQLEDDGTCCGGCHTFVLKDGQRIDSLPQFGQSDSRNYKTMELLKDRFESFGLTLQHEAGWMD